MTSTDHIDTLRALYSPSPWQPIETAPKDGRDVLLYVVTPLGDEWAMAIGMPEGWSGINVGKFSAFRGWEHMLSGKPTHWMPLPEPPK